MTERSWADRARAFSSLYPVPIVFSAALVFAMGCLGLAAIISEPVRWLFAAVGATVALIAETLVVYVVVCKPDVLRVERKSMTIRWADRT